DEERIKAFRRKQKEVAKSKPKPETKKKKEAPKPSSKKEAPKPSLKKETPKKPVEKIPKKRIKGNGKAVGEILQKTGDCLIRGSKTLQAHQKKFVTDFMENKQSRGVLAIHGIGSGKTLTAVVTSQCY